MSTVAFALDIDPTVDLASWLQKERQSVEAKLENHGAALLRGLTDVTENRFQDVVSFYCGGGIEYLYRSTPRTDIGKNIYTATEYPAGLSIPFHSENAFQREWPLLLLFYCMLPANEGGQTPLSDIVKATRRIDRAVQRRFLEKKVMYIRNYNQEVDLPWQTVFQTQSKAEVEAFCRKRAIDFEWTRSGLRTQQVCQALARHPRTQELVWFNQAHLFHPSSLDRTTREIMSEMFREEDLPRNATFGDGSPLDESELDHIRQAYDAEALEFEWRQGDILLVDNMWMAHGRKPFKGSRRVLVAMGLPYSPGAEAES
jgi:hypothetical protein